MPRKIMTAQFEFDRVLGGGGLDFITDENLDRKAKYTYEEVVEIIIASDRRAKRMLSKSLLSPLKVGGSVILFVGLIFFALTFLLFFRLIGILFVFSIQMRVIYPLRIGLIL